MKHIQTLLAAVAFALPCTLGAQNLVVKANAPIADIQPTMYGIFFEDINFGADGGIYAELVKNRSFEFYKPLMGWTTAMAPEGVGSVLINNREDAQSANPRYAAIKVNGGQLSMVNEGFRGMGIKANLDYHFSVWARQKEQSNLSLVVELKNAKGEVVGSTTVTPQGTEWKKYTASFKSSQTDAKGQLSVTFKGQGAMDVDMVSLFPGDTWKNRPGGLRADLVQLLADLKPGFLRFPGGCIVEGHDLSVRYQWKKTVGPIEEREMIVNRWNTEFAHRLTPDYYQTFGLGYYEYFLLSEDLGAEPLPIMNCGMACQFNTGEVVPMDQLDPYIQDVLDLIEFANGDVTTQWGKLRADMGHPAPFNLKYVGVGNEQWGTQYIERFVVFEKAIKAKYPNIIVVTGSGPFPDGADFDYAWGELKKMNAEIVDEHYYRSPQWFRDNATRYDSYDRKGPKVFAGEYAAQSVAIASPDNKNNWDCALSEAAFMTGLERNAEVVTLTSYAPLFAHVEAWQWTPDMIWFDNLRSMGTVNYYVQKMYSNNAGHQVVPMLLDGKAITGQEGLYATAALDKETNEVILKLVNTSNQSKTTNVAVEGVKKLASRGKQIVMQADSKDAMNTLDEPTKISPVESVIKVSGNKVNVTLQPMSFTVVRVKK
ncbi:alpha-N-arabinofuranosidase [Breznakibacter xylanolyticus]|uniref:non-reducing end alpha-L-arabinofuranosidase n=1 Tax=Breznakibacter xylanolyticus TaxID=990 RepID=A0A2W7N8U6_9BACT|nr:alpha-L-arabinofuranosidase C-terminal domain-containing protein [Breznakibacter xylanolyticus]PZX16093.1 alpha-N-arabinofuranosidase [Breznakibacter xylanolyticus]